MRATQARSPSPATRAAARAGRDVGFLAGELLDDKGAIVAVATATVQIRTQMLQDPGEA